MSFAREQSSSFSVASPSIDGVLSAFLASDSASTALDAASPTGDWAFAGRSLVSFAPARRAMSAAAFCSCSDERLIVRVVLPVRAEGRAYLLLVEDLVGLVADLAQVIGDLLAVVVGAPVHFLRGRILGGAGDTLARLLRRDSWNEMINRLARVGWKCRDYCLTFGRSAALVPLGVDVPPVNVAAFLVNFAVVVSVDAPEVAVVMSAAATPPPAVPAPADQPLPQHAARARAPRARRVFGRLFHADASAA